MLEAARPWRVPPRLRPDQCRVARLMAYLIDTSILGRIPFVLRPLFMKANNCYAIRYPNHLSPQ
jgi:hypothetical protein